MQNSEREDFLCPICSKPAKVEASDPLRRVLLVGCERCSEYQITDEASAHLTSSGYASQRFKVSAYLRERNLLREPIITIVSSKEVVQKIKGPAVDIETIVERFPRAVPERLDRSLSNLGRLSEYPGARCRMNIERDYPVFFSENPEAFWATSLMLKDTGWVTGEGPMGHVDAIVTVSGWNRLTNLESVAGRITSKQVFVAMSFDDSLTAAFKDGITKALTLASYEPMRVDLKEHNDKICDVIISEIRRSKFLVADFTLHRPGVYFEAGYALGLGLPVIWTCRQDEVEKAHFDTRQYNHIVWKDPDELCEKLKRRIEATITT